MKVLPLILCIILCAILVFGCSVPAGPSASGASQSNENGPVIGYICKELSQPWFTAVYTALEQTALEHGASKVLVADAEMSPINYLIALDNMISQNVDCIIVCPPDQKLSLITAEKCAEAGVLLMAESDLLYDTEGRLLAPATVVNAYAAGRMMGAWLGEHLITSGIPIEEVGYLCLTMKSVVDYIPRHEGAVEAFLEKVPNFPNKKILYANYDGTAQNAFNSAAAIITAQPGVKYWLVFAPNDEGAQSACRVLEQSDKDGRAAVVGMGGYIAQEEFKKGTQCFMASAYIDGAAIGQIVGKAAMAWLETGQAPWPQHVQPEETYARYVLEAALVTPDNYHKVMNNP